MDEWATLHVTELPTLADLNAFGDVFRETQNATPREALGGLTPNLHNELYGARRRVVDADTIDIYLCNIIGSRIYSAAKGITIKNVAYMVFRKTRSGWTVAGGRSAGTTNWRTLPLFFNLPE